MMIHAILFTVTLLADGAERLPEALAKVAEARRKITSAVVTWSEIPARGPTAGYEILYRTTLARNGDKAIEELGDVNGEHWIYPSDGSAPKELTGLSRFLYLQDGRAYHRSSDAIHLTEYDAETRKKELSADWRGNILAIGMSFTRKSSPDLATEQWTAISPLGFDTVHWTEQRSAGQVVLTGNFDDGSMARYWISPSKGWNVERALYNFEGKEVMECRTSLRRFGEVWFPEEVEYLSEGEQVRVYRITDASFNLPEHPDHLTPNDIGAEAGMTVSLFSHSPKFQSLLPIWTGSEAIPKADWDRRVAAGEAATSPVYEALLKQALAESVPVTVDDLPADYKPSDRIALEPNKWRQYTLDFIRRYALDDEQKRKALEILDACEERARHVFESRKSVFDGHDREFRELRSTPREKQTIKAWAEHMHKGQELFAFLDDIFERDLKPQLERLPTKAQREAVEPRPVAKTRP